MLLEGNYFVRFIHCIRCLIDESLEIIRLREGQDPPTECLVASCELRAGQRAAHHCDLSEAASHTVSHTHYAGYQEQRDILLTYCRPTLCSQRRRRRKTACKRPRRRQQLPEDGLNDWQRLDLFYEQDAFPPTDTEGTDTHTYTHHAQRTALHAATGVQGPWQRKYPFFKFAALLREALQVHQQGRHSGQVAACLRPLGAWQEASQTTAEGLHNLHCHCFMI